MVKCLTSNSASMHGFIQRVTNMLIVMRVAHSDCLDALYTLKSRLYLYSKSSEYNAS